MQRDGFEEETAVEKIISEKPTHDNTIFQGKSNSG